MSDQSEFAVLKDISFRINCYSAFPDLLKGEIHLWTVSIDVH